ncbi:MAG: hypothetical protein ACHQIM_05390 [Sphingobacteriales bacterium]
MKKLLLIILFLAAGFSSLYATDTTRTKTAAADTAKIKVTVQTTTAPTVAKTDTAKKQPTATADCAKPGKIRSTVGWVLIIGIIILFLGVAFKSDILRDSIMNHDDFLVAARKIAKYQNVTDVNKIPKPFSLSRSQLAIWTVVISCSYIYLELVKYFPVKDIAIDSTLLLLMGISAGTAAAGNLINNTSTPEQQGPDLPSEGFFKDILSDKNGINIHRFQNVIWTIIAVMLYLGKIPVVICGQLPTLDSTLIALTGISSATYLGLKINENTPPALPPSPPAQPGA